MTDVSKNYSIPGQTPDAIVIKKGDLGGWIMETVTGAERRTAGFAGPNALVAVFATMLLGVPQPVAAEPAQVATEVAATKVRKPRAPKAAKAEVKVAEPASEPAKRGRGRPKLSDEEKAARKAARENEKVKQLKKAA